MHAVLMTVTIDPAEFVRAQKSLTEEVVPLVSAAPGFVAGYWLEPSDGQAVSLVMFETEDQAVQTAPLAGDSPTPGVTIANVDFRQVAASA